jgi:hypothetical protein
VKLGLIPESIFHGRHAQSNIAFLRAVKGISGIGSYLLIAIPTVLSIYWWRFQHKRVVSNAYLTAIVVLTVGLYLALDGAYQPPILNAKSVKGIAAEINKVAPQTEGTLYEYIEGAVTAKGDAPHYFELNFYLNNRIDCFYKKWPQEGFLLIGNEEAERHLPEFEKRGYQFKLIYQSSKQLRHQTAEIYRFKMKAVHEELKGS